LNGRLVYRLAIVLTKSQLRGYQRNKLLARLFGDPRIIFLADTLAILVPGILGLIILLRIPARLTEGLRSLEAQALAGIPAGVLFAVIVFGVLYEISQPVEILSTNQVNWLPISPAQYVAGSVVSESYIYSFMVSILLGLLLGPALYFRLTAVWVAAFSMAILSLLLGSLVVELLDALTNRISSAFYVKSGRTGIVLRLVFTIILLVLIQLAFSGQLVVYLLNSVVQTVGAGWFVPALWPSAAVLQFSRGQLQLASLFFGLSVVFMVVLFILAAVLRARFWVPLPVSVRMTTKPYRPAQSRLRIPGLNQEEWAVVRKDWRSLVRRREMGRFLAIPFVLAVSMAVPVLSPGGRGFPNEAGLIAPLLIVLFPIAIFSSLLSMTSIGQEGNAVWNLYTAPMKAGQLLKSKLAFSLILSLTFCAGMIGVIALIGRMAMQGFVSLMAVSFSMVLAESATGIYFGSRFPDFRETVRARYVTVSGGLLGMFVGTILGLIIASPVIVSAIARTGNLILGVSLSAVIGVVIFLITGKMAEGQIGRLLENIRA